MGRFFCLKSGSPIVPIILGVSLAKVHGDSRFPRLQSLSEDKEQRGICHWRTFIESKCLQTRRRLKTLWVCDAFKRAVTSIVFFPFIYYSWAFLCNRENRDMDAIVGWDSKRIILSVFQRCGSYGLQLWVTTNDNLIIIRSPSRFPEICVEHARGPIWVRKLLFQRIPALNKCSHVQLSLAQ